MSIMKKEMKMGGMKMGPMMDPRSRFFMALANDQRLKIIELLQEGEKSSTEIMETLGFYPSLLSRHLKMLRNVGIVTARKQGATLFFKLADERLTEILEIAGDIVKKWFDQNKKFFEF